MARIATLLLSGSFTACSFAQAPPIAWEAFFDGSLPGVDEARALIVAPDNSVYVTGTAANLAPQGTITTLRYGPDGAERFIDHVYGPSQETGNSGDAMTIDAQGHVYVTGAFSANNGDLALVKYDADGRVWRKNYEPYWFGSEYDASNGVAVDVQGRIFLAGTITSLSGMGFESFALSADSLGEQLWSDPFSPSSADEHATGVAVSPSGHVYVAGDWWNLDGDGGIDLSVARYTPEGARVWTTGLERTGMDDRATGVVTTADDHVVACGTAYGAGSLDLTVMELDADGVLVWDYQYGGSGGEEDEAVAMRILPDGRIAVAGLTREQDGASLRYNAMTLLLDAGGDTVWTRRYAGPAGLGAWPTGLAVGPQGELVVCGRTTAADGLSTDGLVLVYEPDGSLRWQATYDRGIQRSERFEGVGVNSAGDVVVCGAAYTTADDARYVTVQYGMAVGMAEEAADLPVLMRPTASGVGASFAIHLDDPGVALITVLDAAGRAVRRSSFTSDHTWSMDASGTYLAVVEQGERRGVVRFCV